MRAALDHYEIPYTYFADQKLRDGNLRAKYDVIIFPSIGGSSVSQVNGIPKTGPDAIPYKKTTLTPNLGVEDSSDDIRGGMGIEGLTELVKFVEAGGTLITEGSTTTILPDYGITTRVNVEHPTTLYAKGALMRGIISDKKSPIVYGYTGDQMPVYFSQDPVLSTGGGGFRAAAAVPGVGANITPNATPVALSPYDPDDAKAEPKGLPTQISDAEATRQMMRQFGVSEDSSAAPRVVMQFPAKARRDPSLRRTRRRPGPHQPRPRPRPTPRPGPRRHVRAAPLLALADPGNLRPRLQHHPQLGPPRRRQKGTKAAPARIRQSGRQLTISPATESGAPFMRSHRMSGPSRSARPF